MPYSMQISRTHPTALVILLDQSSSMGDAFGGGGTKSKEAAKVVNRLLTELSIKCAKGQEIYNYYDVSVIGYSSDVVNALSGSLRSLDIQPISTIAESPIRLESIAQRVPDGAGGVVEMQADFPVWVEDVAQGATSMCSALERAEEILGNWLGDHPDSFPPAVLNVTDGEATDGMPDEYARRLTDLRTTDGNVLLYNCHLSSSKAKPELYPSSAEGLADDFAKALFEMSSVLPDSHLKTAQTLGIDVWAGCRGFVFNADVIDLINFIEIGTRAELR